MSTNHKTAAAIASDNTGRPDMPSRKNENKSQSQGIVLAPRKSASTAIDIAPAKVPRRKYKPGEHPKSKFTQALADSIVERLKTRSLLEICEQDDDMPDRGTITSWMELDDVFAANCARARTEHAQYEVECVGKDVKNITPENARAVQVKVDFVKWKAERLLPKIYGNKLQMDVDLSVKRVIVDI